MRLLTRWVALSVATAIAIWLVPGIELTASSESATIASLIIVSGILGIINATIKPFFQIVSGCLVVLTFGLFLLVINAGMLLLTSWISGQLGLDFTVIDFWSAFWGALIISIVGAILGPPAQD